MKVKDFNGNTHIWPPRGRSVDFDDCVPRSQYHLKCRNLLRKIYPLDQILEEVSLPGSGQLTLDFYIPSKKTGIEVHGQQHFKYTPHFHGSMAGFLRHKARDQTKEEWLEMNGIRLIVLRYDEAEDEWRKRLE